MQTPMIIMTIPLKIDHSWEVGLGWCHYQRQRQEKSLRVVSPDTPLSNAMGNRQSNIKERSKFDKNYTVMVD